MKRILIGAVVVLVLGGVVFASLKSTSKKKGPRVYGAEVERRSIARLVKASGEIDPRVKVNISAHVIGKIEKLYVEEGDEIAAGEPFLELEREAFTAARDSAAAQLAIAQSRSRQAEINLRDSELKLNRMRRLAEEQIASAEQLEQAELQYNSSELGLEQAREAVLQARAALDKAKDDLSKATIFAPLSGRVIELNAEEGEVVVSGTMNNPASVIGTIADLSEILAEVEVDETEVAFLELSQTAELKVDALPETSHGGSVVEIGSSGYEKRSQPDVTFFKVKVLLAAPDPALRPGMSVRAEIRTAEKEDVLVVPIQAVVDRPPLGDDGEPEAAEEEVPVVFLLEGDDEDRVRQVPVETGLTDPTHAEVIAGLEEGQKVVTGPYRALKDLDHEDDVRLQKDDKDNDEDS
ncbi:MAG: efflux RND transporter periplasmic adaptor subunit [bacterium]|nr:efflux RND transporter periplasmic adaptor subunit [bacterium]